MSVFTCMKLVLHENPKQEIKIFLEVLKSVDLMPQNSTQKQARWATEYRENWLNDG